MVFVVGLIKYGERTTSLYHASVNKFRNSLLEKYKESKEDLEGVKGLIVDLIFTEEDLERSASKFSSLNARKAFEVVEIELNLMQEALYTKMAVIRGPVGYIVRLVCFMLIFVSFWLWYSKDKSPYHKSDIKITYTLLGGAIVLDAIAFFMLIFSAWRLSQIKSNLVKYELPTENSEDKNRNTNPFLRVLARVPFFHQRWSERIQQLNLIDYCVNAQNQNVEKLYQLLGLKDFADGITYVSEKSLSVTLKDAICSQLRKKADLEYSKPSNPEMRRPKPIYRQLLWYGILDEDSLHLIKEAGYDENLVICHIFTELCYHCGPDDYVCKDDREISKTLSDYMLYLWLRQPNMMTGAVGTNQFKYTNIIIYIKMALKYLDSNDKEWRRREACKKLLEMYTKNDETNHNGIPIRQSSLYPALVLANDLLHRDQKLVWKAIKELWIDILSYAASECSRNAHAAQLSKGGQLITVVWLMMARLRLSEQFIIYFNEAKEEVN